jgi:hypothetical protein
MPTNLCQWHTTGVPSWNRGPFFVRGCPTCEAKAQDNPALRDAPAPPTLRQQRGMRSKFVDWEKIKAVKARAAARWSNF